ncbi:MAG: hypothetical protein LUB59_06235 [Candidatus Gastranaerophilales bacterium]|nr:hypothetical protein [Candidatus Gastranaerophilales bacterium]
MIKRLLGLFLGLALTVTTVFAAKLPPDVQSYLKKNIPNIDIRFDGVIILPDGTLYLPLYPASFKKPEKLDISETFPAGVSLNKKPEVIIFNNDFVLLKVLVNSDGKKTVKRFDKPPIPVKTGILPQDMLVPNGLIIPENIKGIIGNLDIQLSPEQDIKVMPDMVMSARIHEANSITGNSYGVSSVSEFKDKSLYMVSAYSKNISVIDGETLRAEYALAQVSTPVDAKLTKDNKFLIVTAYDSTLVNIISIADDKMIKQLDMTARGGEIVMDYEKNKAYIAAPEVSCIFVLDIDNMTLTQRIKVNGRCEKLALSGNYLLYVDKLSDNVWSMEIDNNYNLKNLGKFPNISKVIFKDGIVFLSSRTKNRIAIINYNSGQLLSEFETVEKPVDMIMHNQFLYVLGAKNNDIQIINTHEVEPVGMIKIGGDGFSTKFCAIPDTSLVIVTDTKLGRYTIVDLGVNKVVKTNGTDLPVNNVIVGKKIKKIN